MPTEPYYRANLALVHHLGFGLHAQRCAEDILALLEPVLRRRGLVLELGCGTGLLTRRLVDAGHRVIATDASPAMLEMARAEVAEAEGFALLTLPGDPLPRADAIVSVGHMLNYLSDEAAIEQALAQMAAALLPQGILAVDVCDLSWGEGHRNEPNYASVTDRWAIITRFSLPTPRTYVREITTFVRDGEGTWRRDDERHVNVLIDTSKISTLLAGLGVDARIEPSFGRLALPDGLVAVIGQQRAEQPSM